MDSDRSRFYSSTKTIGGVVYTAQFNGLNAALAAADSCVLASGAPSAQMLAAYVLEKVIVEPAGLTADDFEDIDALRAVVTFGREVMEGRFRPAKDKSPPAQRP